MEKNRITVRIAGKEYTIVSRDSTEHITRVAHLVDRRMTELNTLSGDRMPTAQLAILTAVNATDDMLKSRDEIRRLKAEVQRLAAELEAKEHDA